jgi:hypothetical protein
VSRLLVEFLRAVCPDLSRLCCESLHQQQRSHMSFAATGNVTMAKWIRSCRKCEKALRFALATPWHKLWNNNDITNTTPMDFKPRRIRHFANLLGDV